MIQLPRFWRHVIFAQDSPFMELALYGAGSSFAPTVLGAVLDGIDPQMRHVAFRLAGRSPWPAPPPRHVPEREDRP